VIEAAYSSLIRAVRFEEIRHIDKASIFTQKPTEIGQDMVTKQNDTAIQSELLLLLQNISLSIEAYVIPVFLLLGIFGNTLSFVIFIRVRKRADAVVQYFTTLAVSDTGVILFLGVSDWINYGLGYITNGRFAFNIWVHSDASCKIMGFTKHVWETVSAWAIALFALERAFIVWFPLKRANITARNRGAVIIAVWVMSIVLSIHRLVLNHVFEYVESSSSTCFYNTSAFVRLILWQFDTTVHNYIPCLLIIVSNTMILIGIQRAKVSVDSKMAVQRKQTQDGHVVVSLLLVSTLYIILMMPPSAMVTYLLFFLESNKNAKAGYVDLIYNILTFLDEFSLMNFCFNFIIYGCTLPFYRKEVYDILSYTSRK
jgi:hypothetical protein